MKRRYRPCPIFDWQSPSRWLRPTSVRECRFLKEETLEQFALYPMPRYCWTLVMNIMVWDIGWSPWHSQISGPWPLLGNRVPGENIRELGAWVPAPTYMEHLVSSFKIVPILLLPHSDVRLRARICWCNIIRFVKKPKNFNMGTKCWHLGEGRRPASRQPRSMLE